MKKKVVQTPKAPPADLAPRPISARDRISLALLLLVGGVLRLLWLDRAAFRADTIHFWTFAQQGLSPGQVWERWMEMMGWSAQMPLPAWLAMIPTGWMGMSVSGFSVRLADALFGVVAIGGAWLAGRLLGGRRFAVVFGLFIALNPMHIQLSREAYFYSTLVAGAFLLLACTLRVARFPEQRWTWGWMALWLAGLFLTTYSHFTGWFLAAVTFLFVLVRMWKRARNASVRLLASGAVVTLPLTWLPWALPYTLKRLGDPTAKAESIRALGEAKTPVAEMLARYAQTMIWGTTTWATIMLIVSALAAVALLSLGARKQLHRWLGGVIVAGLATYLLAMKSQGMYEAVRHAIYMFPLVAITICYGWWSLLRLKGVRRLLPRGPRAGLALALTGLALAVQLPAAWASLRITGSPTPYKDIQAWGNQNLARGTPVLVDRWFEPWNEMRAYPSTNVVFMFNRPNEPLDVFLQSHWREGAEQFFRENPDAAYLEVAKSYWTEPGVGPWPWTRSYFKHQATLANRPGLVLRERGQSFREDFLAADTNRVVVEAFFNTREDVLEQARRDGRPVVVWPGAGWTFVKSGPVGAQLQTQDFMNWRLMEREAVLQLHNLSDQPQRVRLVINALAPRGSKTLVNEVGGRFTFAPGQFMTWETSPFELKPGQNDLTLRDPSGSAAPLLVQRWTIMSPPTLSTAP